MSDMNEMSELKIVCQHLDGLIVEYFNTQDELFAKQERLASNMKDGLFLMAKARYSMGNKLVGAIQYPQEDMTASTTVTMTPADPVLEHDDPYMTFTAHRFTAGNADRTNTPGGDDATTTTTTGGGGDVTSAVDDVTQLRRRRPNVDATTPKADDEEGIDVDADAAEKKISERIEELAIHGDSGDKKLGCRRLPRDPITWFGVLVPQTLRDSQNCFRSVVAVGCEAASLMAKLANLQATIRRLLQRKEDIIGSIDDSSFVIYDESSFLSPASNMYERAMNDTSEVVS